MKNKILCFAVLLFIINIANLNAQRNNVVMVGSSTVYPFAAEIVDRFVQKTGKKAPIVRSTGTGGGFKLFCAGVGFNHPDFNNASRAIKESEVKNCAANGIKNIIELKLGYDILSLVTNKNITLSLTDTEIFLALAAQVPNEKGELIKNPYTNWNQINPNLPKIKISFMGPSPTSGTRDSFLEMVMEQGATKHPALKNKDKKAIKIISHTLRKDGAWVDAGENDNLLLRKVQNSKDVIGIVGYNYYMENVNNVNAISINGKTIKDNSYPLKRPLYIYAKGEHLDVIKDMKPFIDEILSKDALSPNGYLVKKGLSPLSKSELTSLRRKINK